MILEITFWIIILLVSITILVKSSDKFTDSAEKIGLYFGLKPFIIGITIVALGTSLPELIASIFSILNNASEIVIGNVAGSNIANIFIVLGFAGLFSKSLNFKHDNLIIDMIYLISSSLILSLFLIDKNFTIFEAIVCILILINYVYNSAKNTKSFKFAFIQDLINLKNNTKNDKPLINKSKKTFDWKNIFLLVVSCGGLYIGARYVVDSVCKLSLIMGIPNEIISASVVAFGTSLPELTVSITAARKGNLDIAIGNILGSNIFNVLGVMGVSRLFGTIIVTQSMLHFMIPVMLLASIICAFVIFDKKVTKKEGVLLIIFYIIFLIKLFSI